MALLFMVAFHLSAKLNAQKPEPASFKQTFASDYQSYLDRKFAARFENLTIGKETISITVKLNDDRTRANELVIAVLPPHIPSQRAITKTQLLDTKFFKEEHTCKVTITRRSPTGADLAHCRFVLVQQQNQSITPLTPATYAQEWEPGLQRELEPLKGKDRKGLGGIPSNSAKADHPIYDLGLSHVTINIVLNGLIQRTPRIGFQEWEFEGRKYYVNENVLRRYDGQLARLRAENIVVSMILLISNQRRNGAKHLLIHPEAESDGKFAMPNLTSAESANMYRAILTHLAERFSREGPNAGRVTNWIMHNEIDQSGAWTNMGAQPIERYFETFMRSTRLVHQVTRRFNPHSRAFVSLTHHWTKISKGKHVYRVRDLIDLFARASNVEGDFEWGVAYHPYPQNLREPRTWNDRQVTFDFDTPLITSKNIEVLPAYLNQRRIRFEGEHQRAILLSEQGCSSPTMSDEDQRVQTAGIVYMFLRMRQLPTVEAFHYHAYKDTPAVEQARFGLVDENLKPKFSWRIYKALNTDGEQETIEFAKPIIGNTVFRNSIPLKRVTSTSKQDGNN
ncbi:MAG: DUF5722 domain-containing protein [Planctomycetota bacterium]